MIDGRHQPHQLPMSSSEQLPPNRIVARSVAAATKVLDDAAQLGKLAAIPSGVLFVCQGTEGGNDGGRLGAELLAFGKAMTGLGHGES